MKPPHFTLLLCLLFSCESKRDGTPPTPSPELRDALAGFELADGFQIELLAAEPLIADPVAMEIDEDGRLYVVDYYREMWSTPSGCPTK